ncbi:hypothetical protein A8990_12771 [Paenibacillus taihuensis]|uniref:TniQ protein n=1 Tax=Paenibacillus taihuensis TaxID=1156355 RepID=A0A3D9RHD9_9BACL|nr:hypothetical protein A8990_12771 [Paenibacillus taihuensis]
MLLVICWDETWVSKYESAWPIFEKIKCANAFDNSAFFKAFGIERVARLQFITQNQKHRCPLYLYGIDKAKFKQFTNIDLQVNIDLVERLSSLLNNPIHWKELGKTTGFKSHFSYCQECMSRNYHSILTQFLLIHECPFHQINLVEKCPECKDYISYSLMSNSGYVCRCGYRICESIDSPPWQLWGEEKIIKDRVVSYWAG